MTLLVSGFGSVAVAAYGVGLRIITFVMIPAMGLSMATTTIVAQNIGAGKMDRAVRTNTIACLIAFFVPTLAGVLLYLFAVPLSTIFVPKGEEAIAESAQFIHIISLAIGCIGLQQVISGTLRGAGNTLAAMVLSIIAAWVIQFRWPISCRVTRRWTQRPVVGVSDFDDCLGGCQPALVCRWRLEADEARGGVGA